MEIQEYLKYRTDLLEDSKDEDGFIQQSLLLSQVIPSILDSKLIDSEDWTESYFTNTSDNLKINGYSVNESSERLQLFIINEETIDTNISETDLQVSTKGYYDNQFKRATRFINKAIKGHLNEEVQDADPIRPLISKISSSEGIDQFDVIEIFLISTTATIETRGAFPQPKRIEFEDETQSISYTKNRDKIKKDICIKKKLIDLNFLFKILINQGNRETLEIDFQNQYDYRIEVIKAASEINFESYLCVLPGNLLSNLYKDYSSRLLEKNVRSFLQFKGTNKGIRETIRKYPEKFIAFNNGITITSVGKKLEIIDGKTYITSLTDFQIVNGGQTTATIYFTHKDGFSLDKVKVMAKINIALDVSEEGLNELISDISKYSNSQTKVSSVDLDSRNVQLTKLKALSDSIMTPSGKKWFFEKAKGEFNTKLRMLGSNRTRMEKEYPKSFRFSKEQLGKYFTAWGDQPYVVKKGGDKVFRYFIDEIGGNEKTKKSIEIDRNFFECLIAKIILFNELEKIYGQGKNSMGQIRSAVIPYSLSILYKYTDGSDQNKQFDLSRIWKNEKLEDDLKQFFTDLMILVNRLIKKYSESDDLGEYAKNKKLWEDISICIEINEFMRLKNSLKILEKYSVSKKNKSYNKFVEVDFQKIGQIVEIHSKGVEFYQSLLNELKDDLVESETQKIDIIISSILNFENLDQKFIDFEKGLMFEIRKRIPELFDMINIHQNFLIENTLKFIITRYNDSIDKGINIIDYFKSLERKTLAEGNNYADIYSMIGSNLSKGIPPTIKEINLASYYFNKKKVVDKKYENNDFNEEISLGLLREMVDWDSKIRKLTNAERAYIADLAYELKPLNEFHISNAKKHLKTLILSGFKPKS
jgi:hypothetical protein